MEKVGNLKEKRTQSKRRRRRGLPESVAGGELQRVSPVSSGDHGGVVAQRETKRFRKKGTGFYGTPLIIVKKVSPTTRQNRIALQKKRKKNLFFCFIEKKLWKGKSGLSFFFFLL